MGAAAVVKRHQQRPITSGHIRGGELSGIDIGTGRADGSYLLSVRPVRQISGSARARVPVTGVFSEEKNILFLVVRFFTCSMSFVTCNIVSSRGNERTLAGNWIRISVLDCIYLSECVKSL